MSHFKWSIHNLFGHPLYEIFHLLGLKRASEWIHEATLPRSEKPSDVGKRAYFDE